MPTKTCRFRAVGYENGTSCSEMGPSSSTGRGCREELKGTGVFSVTWLAFVLHRESRAPTIAEGVFQTELPGHFALPLLTAIRPPATDAFRNRLDFGFVLGLVHVLHPQPIQQNG